MRPAILVLSCALLALTSTAQVKITSGAEKIAIDINGKSFGDFYVAGKEVSKPYLWPLRAATGTYITRMWPMEKVAEEFDGDDYKGAKNKKPDHQHQRGLWFAHDTVINADGEKLDFWNNEVSYNTPDRGRMTLKNAAQVKSGKDKGSVVATFE